MCRIVKRGRCPELEDRAAAEAVRQGPWLLLARSLLPVPLARARPLIHVIAVAALETVFDSMQAVYLDRIRATRTNSGATRGLFTGCSPRHYPALQGVTRALSGALPPGPRVLSRKTGKNISQIGVSTVPAFWMKGAGDAGPAGEGPCGLAG